MSYAVAPVVSPSTPVVNQGLTIQFSETAVDQGSWTCVGTTSTGGITACAGSINMTTGLYTAPSSVTAQHVYGGLQILPNNDVYNIRIDSLPVHSSSTLYMNTVNVGGTPNWQIDFPINYVDGSVTDTMGFHFTPSHNGTFEVPAFPTAKAEHGWFSALQNRDDDHHVIMVNPATAMLSEFYQYSPSCLATAASVTSNVATVTCVSNPSSQAFLSGQTIVVGGFTGADTFFNLASTVTTSVTSTSISYALNHANATASSLGAISRNTNGSDGLMNSASGIKYSANVYDVPTEAATDAAGMKLQGLILNLQEVERAAASGGNINHAFRNTFGIGFEASSCTWPATTFASDGNVVPFGVRARLKSSFNISSFSSIAQIYLRALQRYGTFNIDGGSNWPMNAEVTRWPKAYYDALTEISSSATLVNNMEFVDESSIMVSTGSELTKYNREMVVFTRTSDVVKSTADVVLVGPAVSFKDDIKYFMAGTPATDLNVLNNYGGYTCSMSPSLGSLTSGCVYTPPASQVNMSSTTITATSLVNSSATAIMTVAVFPSTGIFVVPSQTSDYVDATGTTWISRIGRNAPDTMGCCACDNQASFAATTDSTLWKCYVSQIGDAHMDFNVPNGAYQVLYRYGTQSATGAEFLKLTIGSNEIFSNVDPSLQAGGQFHLFASTTTAVTSNKLSVGIWNMNDVGAPVSSLSIIQVSETNQQMKGSQSSRGGIKFK